MIIHIADLTVPPPTPCPQCDGTRVGSMTWLGGSASNWRHNPCPECCCTTCGRATDTPPVCARCDIADDAAAVRRADV